MNRWIALLLAVFAFSAFSAVARTPLAVVATLPDLAWMASEIGGPEVTAVSLLEGTENPHYVDAVPSFIVKAASADVVLAVGLQLEIGWLPKVLARSSNAKVQPGGSGYVELGSHLSVLGRPKGPVDRSMGDVHPGGNPHFWLSPSAMAEASGALADALTGLRPEKAAAFTANRAQFQKRMQAQLAKNRKRLSVAPSGKWLMEYHEEFTYFLKDHGIESFGSVEEKPGVPPSAGRLARVALDARRAGVKVLLAAEYTPKATLKRFSELSGISVVVVPTSSQPGTSYATFPQWQDHVVSELVEALKPKAD